MDEDEFEAGPEALDHLQESAASETLIGVGAFLGGVGGVAAGIGSLMPGVAALRGSRTEEPEPEPLLVDDYSPGLVIDDYSPGFMVEDYSQGFEDLDFPPGFDDEI
jgi:hypothetical protein